MSLESWFALKKLRQTVPAPVRHVKADWSHDFLATNTQLKELLARRVSPILEGEGFYRNCERSMVYSVISSAESQRVIHAIKEADGEAFINAVRTDQLSGRFYQKPEE